MDGDESIVNHILLPMLTKFQTFTCGVNNCFIYQPKWLQKGYSRYWSKIHNL